MIKFIRKIIKNGRGSYYINLPKELVASMSLRERQKLTIRQSGEKIIIKAVPEIEKQFKTKETDEHDKNKIDFSNTYVFDRRAKKNFEVNSDEPIIITREECGGNYPAMEYQIINKQYGLPNYYWFLIMQTYKEENGRKFDVLKIRILKDEKTRELLDPPVEKEIKFELK